MKKILSILLCGVVAFTSCSLQEPVYRITNLSDYLTCKNGVLYSDYGVKFTVTEDLTDKNWQSEGNRMYAIFDIVNIDYDITLKSYLPASFKTVAGVQENIDPDPSDPVDILDCGISGGYLNMVVSSYTKTGGDYEHKTDLFYYDTQSTLTFFLVHDGGGESPVNYPESSLTKVTSVYSFPLSSIVPSGESRYVVLEYDCLAEESDGTKVAIHVGRALLTQQLQF